MRAGTAGPVGDPEMLPCPSDVEADTMLSFLTGQFGDLIDTAWTSTQRHPRIAAGWIFTAPQDKWPGDTEILCVPFVQGDDGALQPMFELLADQRQELKELASSGKLDGLSVVKLPQREYRPGPGQAGGGRDS